MARFVLAVHWAVVALSCSAAAVGGGVALGATNVPPAVAITAPVSGNEYCLSATIHIRAAASDPDGTIAQVQFFVGITNLVGTVTNPPYRLTLTNVGPLSFSRHGDPIVLSAVATADLGASTTSAPVTVNQSQGLPCDAYLYTLSPTNDSVFNSPATFTMNVLLQSFFGGTGPVRFYANTNLLGTLPPTDDTFTPTNDPTGGKAMNLLAGIWSSFAFTVSNLPAGNYSLTPAAESYGFSRGASDPVSITVLPANIPPSVRIVSLPRNGLEFIAPAEIRLEANAADRDGTVDSVQFFYGNLAVNESATNAISPVLTNAPFVFIVTNLTPLLGRGDIVAVAIDDGGASRTSAPVNLFAISVTQPLAVNLVAPTDGTIFASSAPIPVSAGPGPTDNNVNPVEFYLGTNVIGSVLNPPYQITLSNLADGTYSISAGIRDLGGNLILSDPATIRVTTLLISTLGMISPAHVPLRVTGVIPGATAIVQRSTNLIDWVGFGTNLATTNVLDFVDSASLDSSARYYRCFLAR